MAGTFTNLLFHIIFSTKHRQPLISPEIRPELEKCFGGILRNEGGVLLETGGMPDHVHLVTRLRADRSVAETTRVVKANSSKWMNEQGMDGAFAWQAGYGAFTVSSSQLGGVIEYVRGRRSITRGRRFRKSSSYS